MLDSIHHMTLRLSYDKVHWLQVLVYRSLPVYHNAASDR